MLGVRCSQGLDSEQGVGWAERTDHEDLGETHTYTHTQRQRENHRDGQREGQTDRDGVRD